MHAANFKLFHVAREIPRAWAVGRRICDGSRCHNSFFCGKHAKVSSPFTRYITEAEAAASEREKLFCLLDSPFLLFLIIWSGENWGKSEEENCIRFSPAKVTQSLLS